MVRRRGAALSLGAAMAALAAAPVSRRAFAPPPGESVWWVPWTPAAALAALLQAQPPVNAVPLQQSSSAVEEETDIGYVVGFLLVFLAGLGGLFTALGQQALKAAEHEQSQVGTGGFKRIILDCSRMVSPSCRLLGDLQLAALEETLAGAKEDIVKLGLAHTGKGQDMPKWTTLALKERSFMRNVNSANAAASYTQAAAKAPFVRQMIEAIEQQLGCTATLASVVRLAQGGVHKIREAACEPGAIRIRLPICSSMHASMTIDGQQYLLDEGKLHVTSPEKEDTVMNFGPDLVHLVVDALPFPSSLKALSMQHLKTPLCPVRFLRKQGANSVVVTFSGLGMVEGDVPRFELGRTLMERCTFAGDILQVRDLKRQWFMQGLPPIANGVDAMVRLLQGLLQSYDRVYFVGISSGAFAALHYGHLLGVQRVLAISPQTDLTVRGMSDVGDGRFEPLLARVRLQASEARLNLCGMAYNRTVRVHLHYSGTNLPDTAHASRFSNHCANVATFEHMVPAQDPRYSDGHKLALYLKDQGELAGVIDNCLT